jgi:hypothetical protein
MVRDVQELKIIAHCMSLLLDVDLEVLDTGGGRIPSTKFDGR